jgi:AcrR family transcriptional regulator
MAIESERHPRRRTPLTRERVLRAAVRLADKGGVDAVSMRRIGQLLRVEAMSLYKHVTDKDDILDGMVDFVFSEIELPARDSKWKEAMRRRAISAREALLRHPWAIGLMDSRSNGGPATIRHHDAVIGSLRRGGFPIAMTAHAFALLDSYIYGFVLQEVSLPFRTPEELTELATALVPEPTADLPYFSEMVTDYALKPGYSFANEFEFGLDLILDGIERAASATPQP